MNEPDFQKFLERKTTEHWETLKKPYLLTEIPDDFESEFGESYKNVLKEKKLKAFAMETSSSASGYKFIQHPTQKTKIGLIPYSEDYSFDATTTDRDEGSHSRPPSRSKTRYATIAFLEAISTLPEDDQRRIKIPAGIIAKLLSQ